MLDRDLAGSLSIFLMSPCDIDAALPLEPADAVVPAVGTDSDAGYAASGREG
jgi:hypothetical protein